LELSTPSLGITGRDQEGLDTVRLYCFQLPLSGSHHEPDDTGSPGHADRGTFNSLSRDHVFEGQDKLTAEILSTPSLGITRRGGERDDCTHPSQLSTPSLGITSWPLTIQIHLNGPLSTPSLGITHEWLPASEYVKIGSLLSTPSLGITSGCRDGEVR
jgi:hypothetical protein